jgi:hypothetical protein
MRLVTWPTSPHSSRRNPAWLSRAARTASAGPAKAAQNPSPRDWTTTPPWSAIARRMTAS